MTRVRVAAAIKADLVRWYSWSTPWACHVPTGHKVTSQVRALVRADLAEVEVEPEFPLSTYRRVVLTAAGELWLAEHGGAS